ncbi:hypothetical protein DPMN_148403 [Dreissena polymorpha]|uniref:Uncharacterized protein n=1 Tax=Dreissena polymorpha TaxID=45954 RepID=A0A9D4FDY4_DREPO|nr:hypothetical protein DPMN_148403 [Dreissena polymorpha]
MASVGVQCQTTNLCMSVGVQCQLLFLEQVIIRTSTPRKATPTTYINPMDTSFQSVFSAGYEDNVTADPDIHLNQTCSTEADHGEVSK